MPEATQHFKQQLREAFDSLQVGQIFTYRRTFTEGDVSLFIGVTGDINPYHYTNQDDIEVLKGNFRGFPSNVRLAK